MKCSILITLLVLSLLTPTVLASDDGQTRPRLTYGAVLYQNAWIDIISTTNGAGNIKGIQCKLPEGAYATTVDIFVNGGSAQTLTLDAGYYLFDSSSGRYFTGWIPLNVRFTSSIRVRLQKGYEIGENSCVVSWALD